MLTNLQYSDPEGGYFVLVNLSKVQLPADYPFPPHVASRPRDFKLCWFCIKELGVAAIPPTEFFTDKNAHLAEDWLRFAVCKEDKVFFPPFLSKNPANIEYPLGLTRSTGEVTRTQEVHQSLDS